MEVNKILCPVDFSESSEQALKYATFLAWRTFYQRLTNTVRLQRTRSTSDLEPCHCLQALICIPDVLFHWFEAGTANANSFEFLQKLDKEYPDNVNIRLILDNHSAHKSKETQRYLKSKPNRFTFVFTPTHGSWLNLIEAFFSKIARSFLRHIRVHSKQELMESDLSRNRTINQEPVIK